MLAARGQCRCGMARLTGQGLHRTMWQSNYSRKVAQVFKKALKYWRKAALLIAGVGVLSAGVWVYHMPRPLAVFIIWQNQSEDQRDALRDAVAKVPWGVCERETRHAVVRPSAADLTADTTGGFVFVAVSAEKGGHSKKRLRQDVETHHPWAASRIAALRRIVPVYQTQQIVEVNAADTHQLHEPGAQLCDDMIYARDNFGGFAVLVEERAPGLVALLPSVIVACAAPLRFTLKNAACIAD